MEKENIDKIINALKQQAELFLLNADEFYPFGTYINKKGAVIPVGAYFENDKTPSLEIIDLIEKAFNDHLQKGDCKIAAIAIDVTVKENNETYDAVEMRFFEVDKEVYKKYFKYEVKENTVQFFETPQ